VTLRWSALGLVLVVVLTSCTSRSAPSAAEDDGTTAASETLSETPSDSPETAGSWTPDPDDPCEFAEAPGEPAPVGGPPPGEAEEGTAVFTTNHGDIGFLLAPDKAPCTVRSITHLVSEGFYDGVNCHRLTTSEGLKVLQCGDPNGDGSGGPGYTIPDEPPTDLRPAPANPSLVVYPRGTVAMAKTQEPDSGGSQFFLVYADSTLPPEYTVFGALDPTGLATVDAIAANGVVPSNSAEDGAPVEPVEIERASIRR
jgi:peptidyl-prolyl cis-trans isomerase B (cyclophilin B)